MVLWLAASGCVALYVAVSGDFSDTYGPLAGVMALLLWATVTGIALLLGVAVAAQLEGARAGIGHPLLRDDDGDGIPDELQPAEPTDADQTGPERQPVEATGPDGGRA